MERTTMFLHFAPDERVPAVGETVSTQSQMTNTTYRVRIRAILGQETLPDGRVQVKVSADREVAQ